MANTTTARLRFTPPLGGDSLPIAVLLSLPIVFLGIAVWSDNPEHMEKMQLFFEYFGNLPFWYQTIFVGVIASVYGLKATDLIKRK